MTLNESGNITSNNIYEPFGKQIPLMQGENARLSFISKEKDIESSLGDFGVRKYDEEIGIFTSIDPLWEKYLGWSPYHYCGNNPIGFIDRNGMWMEEEHNQILDKAFSGFIFVQIFKDASLMADEDQGLEGSYKHAMKAPWQTVDEAENLYNDFLEQQIQKFATTENLGEALFELGLGMHAKMDAWAPSHNGFQTWNGLGASVNHPNNIIGQAVNVVKGFGHVLGEISPWLSNVFSEKKLVQVAEDVKYYYHRALDARAKYQEKNQGKKSDE